MKTVSGEEKRNKEICCVLFNSAVLGVYSAWMDGGGWEFLSVGSVLPLSGIAGQEFRG